MRFDAGARIIAKVAVNVDDAGVTQRPAPSIRFAPAGIGVSAPPTAETRPSTSTIVALSMRAPSPSYSVAPVMAVGTPG
jgi:hypothetical protein